MNTKLVPLFLAVALAAPAANIFYENFDGATPGFDPTLGVIPGTQFTLVAGSIDVNGATPPGYYPELCVAPTSGNCIDTTGAAPWGRGTISTTDAIFFTPGEYVLSFDLEGWYDTIEGDVTDAWATVQVSLGPLFTPESFTVVGGDQGLVEQIPFTVVSSNFATLTFSDQEGKYSFAGGILDNVSIDTVDPPDPPAPEPGTMLLGGVGALIVFAGKRARQ